jgi:hypothetical protein
VSIRQWQSFARERIAAHGGDHRAAWVDVLAANRVLTVLASPRQALRSLDAAIDGFCAATAEDGQGSR